MGLVFTLKIKYISVKRWEEKDRFYMVSLGEGRVFFWGGEFWKTFVGEELRRIWNYWVLSLFGIETGINMWAWGSVLWSRGE